MSIAPGAGIVLAMLALAAILLIMGLFQLFRRYGGSKVWTGARARRARFQGFLAVLAALLVGAFGYFYWVPQTMRYAQVAEQLSGFESREQTLNTKYSSLQTRHTKLSSSLGRVKTRESGLAQKLANLKSHHKGLLTKIRGFTTEKRGWVQREQDLSADIASLQERRDRLENSNIELVEQKAALKKRLAGRMVIRSVDHRSELDNLRLDLNRQKDAHTILSHDYTDLESSYQRQGDTLSTEKTGRERYHRSVNMLMTQEQALRARNVDLNSKIGSLNVIMAGLRTRNSSDTSENNAELEKLRSDLNARNQAYALLSDDYRGLAAENTKLRKTKAMPPARPAMRTSGIGTIPMIYNVRKTKTALNLVSNDYDIYSLSNDRLIKQQSGEYYRVVLKNPATGKGYQFASGSYTEVTPTAGFNKSLDRAITDIQKALDGHVDYRLYVRGSASKSHYRGELVSGHEYREVDMMRRIGDNQYAYPKITMTHGDVIKNRDLPNLRAAYLQSLIHNFHSDARPEILQGVVSDSKDESNQSVGLVLYVKR